MAQKTKTADKGKTTQAKSKGTVIRTVKSKPASKSVAKLVAPKTTAKASSAKPSTPGSAKPVAAKTSGPKAAATKAKAPNAGKTAAARKPAVRTAATGAAAAKSAVKTAVKPATKPVGKPVSKPVATAQTKDPAPAQKPTAATKPVKAAPTQGKATQAKAKAVKAAAAAAPAPARPTPRLSVGAQTSNVRKSQMAAATAATAMDAQRKSAPMTPKDVAARTAEARGTPKKSDLGQRHGFKTNEYIVYPAHGVGQIVGIEEQEIAGIALELFVITFDKDKMTLRVPTTKLTTVGMRKLAEEPTVKKALDTLKGRARVKRTMWSRRAQEYEQKIHSGDLISIAEVVRDLYRSESQPEQSYSERQLYEQALDRMAREIGAVENLDDRGAVQRITDILSKSAKSRRAAEQELEQEQVQVAEDGEAVQAA